MVKPFLKWAGGKRQLLPVLEKNFPDMEKVTHYLEPFLGGGAVYLHIAQNYPLLNDYVLLDKNVKLINAYKVVRDNPGQLIQDLMRMQAEYLTQDEEGRKNYFLQLRRDYNNSFSHHLDGKSRLAILNAACLVMLNRTCFNGLYRVNRKGEFNVPHGKYKNPTICDEENIKALSKILKKVNILESGEFEGCEEFATPGSFIYLDPPYRPVSKTSSFNSYAGEFEDYDQLRLREMFVRLDKMGAKVMLSNSDSGDGFFDRFYEGYNIQRVKARRNVNSKSNKRGAVKEVLIKNYE